MVENQAGASTASKLLLLRSLLKIHAIVIYSQVLEEILEYSTLIIMCNSIEFLHIVEVVHSF